MNDTSALQGLEITGGMIVGTDHYVAGKNCQDFYGWAVCPECLVAVVTDGCGTRPHSEVGAKLGAHIFSRLLAESFADGTLVSQEIKGKQALINHTARETASVLGKISTDSMSGYHDENILDFFLFSMIGVVIKKDLSTVVFAIGDGAWSQDGRIQLVNQTETNTPVYLGYHLLNDHGGFEEEDLSATIIAYGQFDHMASNGGLLIGSDGLRHMQPDKAIPSLPGEVIGSLSQFWTNDAYFANPDAIRRRLAVINRVRRVPDWKNERMDVVPGPLRDDVALVVIKKKP